MQKIEILCTKKNSFHDFVFFHIPRENLTIFLCAFDIILCPTLKRISRYFFQKNFKFFSDLSNNKLFSDTFSRFEQSVQTFFFCFFFYLSWEKTCRNMFAECVSRKWKCMQFGDSKCFYEFESVLKFRFGFGGKSYDKIRSNTYFYAIFSRNLQGLSKEISHICSIVMATHEFENS